MTFCEVTFRLQTKPTEEQLTNLDRLKGRLYGLRGFTFEEDRLRISYDASRVTTDDVAAALRGSGISVLHPTP